MSKIGPALVRYSTLFALALLATPALADVRVVAPTGAPYAEIQSAVDAAHDGDVILVKSGTYQSFVVRDLDLAIVADTNALVVIDGAIRVGGIAATRTLLLAGLKATGKQSTNSASRHGLFAHDCAGSLRVLGCELTGVPLDLGTGSCYEGQGASLENCADVAFVGCALKGSEAPPTVGYQNSTVPSGGYADGGHGLYAQVSALALYDSTLRGGRAAWNTGSAGTCAPPPYALDGSYIGAGGEGYRGAGTFFVGSNCTFTGALGWDSGCISGCFCTCAGQGGNGLVHDTGPGNGFLLGGARSGGAGGSNSNFCGCISVGSCAHQCCGIGQTSCQAPSGVPVLGAPTTWTGAARSVLLTRVVRESQLATIQYHGQPGDRVELVGADRTTFGFAPLAHGVSMVSHRPPQLVQQVGTIGPSGVLTQSWTIPDLGAGVQSRVLWFQAAMIDASGQTTLSSPAAVVLLDSAF